MLLLTRKRKKKPGKETSPAWFALESSRPAQSCPWLWRAATAAPWLAVLAAVHLAAPFGLAAKKKTVSRSVTGLVLDKDENGISGATVELTDLQSGKKLAISAQEGGHYKFSDLEPNHDYQVQATHKGLSSEARKVSSFDTRITFVINLKIEPPK